VLTLLPLTAVASGVFANGGQRVPPTPILSITDSNGKVIEQFQQPAASQVIKPEYAYLLTSILSDDNSRCTPRVCEFGRHTVLELPDRPAAAKTGTSEEFRANWTIGYTPNIAIGVWVGNADGAPMLDLAGVEGAGPIWRDAMMAASLSRSMSPFVRPAGIVDATICAPTGLLPGPDCASPTSEIFAAGTVPTAHETYYFKDPDGRISIDPPIEARDWARAAGMTLRSDGASTSLDVLRILAPVAGTTVHFAPEIASSQLLLRVVAARGIETVTFAIDGRVIGDASGSDPALLWPLELGGHTLRASARFADGSFATVTSVFEVKR